MSLQEVHLRKILRIMFLERGRKIAALREDIRADIARAQGRDGNPQDFYGPFWRDAKDHVFDRADLRVQTQARIERNPRRSNLYGRLSDGFLLWWDNRRRWTNQPFVPAAGLSRVVQLPGINANIKFANILAVRDGQDEDHFVYPYWFPEPALTDEMGRLALWALCEAFPTVNREELRVLDVVRGQTFSIDRNPLQGDERTLFQGLFGNALQQWQTLRREYPE